MTDSDALEAALNRVRARGVIVATERSLNHSRYRGRRLTAAEKAAALEQKAYYLGRDLSDQTNPFEDWKHPGAERLAQSYKLGRC